MKHRSSWTGARTRGLVAATLAAGFSLVSAGAQAVSITSIAPGLAASGQVGLTISYSDGNVTQSSDIRAIEGGAVTSSAFTTAPGAVDMMDDGTTGPVPNPLLGALTDIDDGFGVTSDIDALYETDDYQFVTEILIDLENNSAGDTYKVTIKVNYDHTADAGGLDAYAESQIEWELDNVNVDERQVYSDTSFGDELNYVGLGTFGDVVSDAGMAFFDVMLAPGQTSTVEALLELEGLVWESTPGAVDNSNLDAFLEVTIAEVMCVSGPGCQQLPPPGVPEPGTLVMLGLALSGLGLARRRRR